MKHSLQWLINGKKPDRFISAKKILKECFRATFRLRKVSNYFFCCMKWTYFIHGKHALLTRDDEYCCIIIRFAFRSYRFLVSLTYYELLNQLKTTTVKTATSNVIRPWRVAIGDEWRVAIDNDLFSLFHPGIRSIFNDACRHGSLVSQSIITWIR